MLALYRIYFAPPRKSYPKGLLLTHRKGCGSVISVKERIKLRGAAQISKVESHISVWFLPYFSAVWTPIWPVAEVSKKERGLEATETEVNTVFRNEDGNLVHQTSRLTAPTLCSMCVNDLCQKGLLLLILYWMLGFRGATKRYPVYCEHSLARKCTLLLGQF